MLEDLAKIRAKTWDVIDSRTTQPDPKLRGLNPLIRPNQREGEMTPCGGVVADMAAVNWLEVERAGPQHFLRTG